MVDYSRLFVGSLLAGIAVLLLTLQWDEESSHHDEAKIDNHNNNNNDDDDIAYPSYAAYVIGDLHGDVMCARHWVDRTGLIDRDGNWLDETSQIVFMGDYVDKGPTSRQTVEFVKELTERYPKYVTAIMGNHEIELLRDRDPNHRPWNGRAYYQLAYSSVHPGEYLNYLDRPADDVDLMAVDALYNASVDAYSLKLYRQMYLEPEVDSTESILRFVDEGIRDVVGERLDMFQRKYLDAFRSDKALGQWLEQRPILHRINETVFVHGGIPEVARQFLEQIGIDGLNEHMAQHTPESKGLNSFLYENTIGQVLYQMLVFRGNHKERQSDACRRLPSILPDGLSRLAVGHTPGSDVRFSCGNTMLALDSSLGRFFRNSGNLYCPGEKSVLASNGRYVCPKMNNQCEGQILKMRGGVLTKLSADSTWEYVQASARREAADEEL